MSNNADYWAEQEWLDNWAEQEWLDMQYALDTEPRPGQHCTYEGDDDYTFSHTAEYCGRPQPRRCNCAFCY